MIYLRLFWEFFKAGLFAFGGGMATLPFLYDISERTGWFSAADIADFIAVSESTPGPIGVNMATYGGYMAGGIPGGIIATLGLVTPSVIVICIIARMLSKFHENPLVKKAFYGLKPITLALISYAAWQIISITLFDFTQTGWGVFIPKAWALFAVIFILQWVFKNAHPLWWIAIGAAAGIIFKF